jgi:ornithine cyclodeaminase
MAERPTRHPGLWISEREAAHLLTLEDAIDVLAEAYRSAVTAGAQIMPRAHASHEHSILHAVGGILPAADLAGTKTWLYSPAGASPLEVLFRLSDGGVAAVIEAFTLGQYRTAATSALATRLLARPDADVLALLGTGRQARAQAEGIAAVRPLRRIQVFGRDPGRRDALCQELREQLQIEVEGFAEVSGALRGAAIVTSITRSAQPIVSSEMLEAGMHINAVGAIVASRSELDTRAVACCQVIVADSPAQARQDSGELRAAAAAGLLRLESVVGLGELVVDPSQGRRRNADITLFKPLGVGLSDVALGAELLLRARRAGLGSPLPANLPYNPQAGQRDRSDAHV